MQQSTTDHILGINWYTNFQKILILLGKQEFEHW